MPAKNGLGLRDRSDLGERSQPKRLPEAREHAALFILQRDARSESRSQRTILGDEVFVAAPKLVVDATRNGREDALPGHSDAPLLKTASGDVRRPATDVRSARTPARTL